MSHAAEKARHNDFEHLQNWWMSGGREPHVLRIWCSQCGASDVGKLTKGCTTIGQANAERMFRNKKWIIGRNRRHDVCPECQKREKEQRTAKRAIGAEIEAVFGPKQAQVIDIKPHLPAEKEKTVTMEAKAAPPREMTKSDRRIIFSQIEDVYVDENSGYSAGWSDQRVAMELGVPLGWVRDIREENFGPEGLSSEARAVIEDARKVIADIAFERESFAKVMNAHQEKMGALNHKVEQLGSKLALIEKGKL